jgi:hypothetical protein
VFPEVVCARAAIPLLKYPYKATAVRPGFNEFHDVVILNGPPEKLFVVPVTSEDIDWLAPELIMTDTESGDARGIGPALI